MLFSQKFRMTVAAAAISVGAVACGSPAEPAAAHVSSTQQGVTYGAPASKLAQAKLGIYRWHNTVELASHAIVIDGSDSKGNVKWSTAVTIDEPKHQMLLTSYTVGMQGRMLVDLKTGKTIMNTIPKDKWGAMASLYTQDWVRHNKSHPYGWYTIGFAAAVAVVAVVAIVAAPVAIGLAVGVAVEGVVGAAAATVIAEGVATGVAGVVATGEFLGTVGGVAAISAGTAVATYLDDKAADANKPAETTPPAAADVTTVTTTGPDGATVTVTAPSSNTTTVTTAPDGTTTVTTAPPGTPPPAAPENTTTTTTTPEGTTTTTTPDGKTETTDPTTANTTTTAPDGTTTTVGPDGTPANPSPNDPAPNPADPGTQMAMNDTPAADAPAADTNTNTGDAPQSMPTDNAGGNLDNGVPSSTTDPGTTNTDPGSTNTDPGSTNTDPGSTNTDPGSTNSDPGGGGDTGGGGGDTGGGGGDTGGGGGDPGGSSEATHACRKVAISKTTKIRACTHY